MKKLLFPALVFTLLLSCHSKQPKTPGYPLIIVDSVEYSRIPAMDQEKVKSITILKDKAATSAYGDKGSNGVIVFEMKK